MAGEGTWWISRDNYSKLGYARVYMVGEGTLWISREDYSKLQCAEVLWGRLV